MNGAVIVISSGGVEDPAVGPLILGRRRNSVIERDAVRHTSLTGVCIAGAAVPRPFHFRSYRHGLGTGREHVVLNGYAVGRRRRVAARRGSCGRRSSTATASIK